VEKMKSPVSYLKDFLQNFTKLPDCLQPEQYHYFVLTNYLYLLALFAHAMLLVSFWLVGVRNLALFNIGSCLLFFIIVNTNLRGYLTLGTSLGTLEVIAHAIFCVYTLGWDSGFHYFILGLVVMFFAAPWKNQALRITLAAVTSVIYILLNYFTRNAIPVSALDPVLLNIFNIGNLLIFIFVISVAIYASDNAVAKAEAELAAALEKVKQSQQETEKKNRELAKKNKELVESNQRADRIFSALAEALPGTVLEGKYRLDDKIGSGGYGAVYRATHLAMKNSIAVKVFRPMPGNDSAEALERFQQEAVSASRVHHPNAVLIFDSGVSAEGIAYIAMELLEGHPLTNELEKKGVLSVERCAEILMPVCDVLSQVHEVGIVHRDIKPDNIFLHQTAQGEVVKVVDFGIAKPMTQTSGMDIKNLTATGGFIGTATYMSPERFEGKQYDGRSDVYSLGVMLFEMLCGRVPFLPGDAGQVGVVMQHLMQQPPSLREFNPTVPETIEAVVMRALEKDPVNRPTAKVLAQEFEAALGRAPALN
jgi:hypothetical protein